MADSNNKKANKLQTVKKIETAEEKSASKPVRCPKYEKLSGFSCLMTLQKAKEQEIQRERLT